MFKALIVLISAAALSTPVWADHDKDRSFPGPRMIKKLNLTPAQVDQIKKIHDESKQGRESFGTGREKMKKARKELREAMQSNATDAELRQKFEEMLNDEPTREAKLAMKRAYFEKILKIRAVLTPEQRKEFRGMMGRHEFGKKGRGHRELDE